MTDYLLFTRCASAAKQNTYRNRMANFVLTIFLIAMIAFVFSKPGFATEITIAYKNISLNGNLELATGKKLTDGVILITHAGLAHNGMEIYVYLQKLLRERGYNSLAINISFGIDNRHGMLDCQSSHQHLFADAAKEINAWIEWLKKQGVSQVTLLGHSRGGAQTALFASQQDSEVIHAIVLLAPDTHETNDARAYINRYKKPLAPILEKAQILVKANNGKMLMKNVDFLYCSDTSVSAATIVSYYGPDPRLDTAYLLPAIKKPILLLIAGNDQVLVNNRKYFSFTEQKNISLIVIDDADHFFRDLFSDDAVDEISAFLSELNIH